MPAAILTALVCLLVAIPKPEPQERKIPLDQCYATFPSKGVESIPSDSDVWKHVPPIAYQSGASNVFLVRGTNLREAILSTHSVLFGGAAVDRPVKESSVARDAPLWLAAYLGKHGNVGAWSIHSASTKDNAVRLVCPYVEPTTIYGMSFRYFVWVRLGQLPPGTYLLELCDKESGDPYLTRRVVVRNP